MKITFYQYKYAPESLEIYLNGALLPKKYYSNLGYEFFKSENKIKFIREKIINKNKQNISNKKWIKISFLHNNDSLKWLDETYTGTISSYKELILFINNMKNKHNLSDNLEIKFINRKKIKKV